MRRGSILHYLVGSQQLRVVVLSEDRYNPAHALIAPVRERSAPALAPAFLVPLTRQDWPTAAVIDLSRARSLDPDAVAGPAGQLTQTTVGSLTNAIRTYLSAIA
ncbi:MAG TPA: type II toxin-antitoxin system PemK/MazF family toxin [Micromonosporaceae bacterium]|jgi:mRNA-degrading endonuclease toxin of MazEF toxin-antitoxin module